MLATALSNSAVPEDYTALHRQYFRYVVALVMKAGIHPDNAEDVASDIMFRFWERDFLTAYDPNYGGEGRGRFVTFLSGFVTTYVRSHRERQNREVRRYECVDAVEESFVASAQHDYYNCDFVELVAVLRDIVSQEKPRSHMDVCDLTGMLELLLTQVIRDGVVSVREMQSVFGISQSTAYTWRSRLMKVLRNGLEE